MSQRYPNLIITRRYLIKTKAKAKGNQAKAKQSESKCP